VEDPGAAGVSIDIDMDRAQLGQDHEVEGEIGHEEHVVAALEEHSEHQITAGPAGTKLVNEPANKL